MPWREPFSRFFSPCFSSYTSLRMAGAGKCCVLAGACVPWRWSDNPPWSRFSPSTFMKVPGIKRRLPGLGGEFLYLCATSLAPRQIKFGLLTTYCLSHILYLCACSCQYVHGCTCVYAHVCGGQRSEVSLFLRGCLVLMRQVLL